MGKNTKGQYLISTTGELFNKSVTHRFNKFYKGVGLDQHVSSVRVLNNPVGFMVCLKVDPEWAKHCEVYYEHFYTYENINVDYFPEFGLTFTIWSRLEFKTLTIDQIEALIERDLDLNLERIALYLSHVDGWLRQHFVYPTINFVNP